jgi:enoyl-CoA hydratase
MNVVETVVEEAIKLPEFETLELRVDGHVAEVCLNRPDKANAMNAAMWPDLQRCFEWLDTEASIRVVILAGNGRHFCAGIDLEMLAGMFGEGMEPARRAEAFRRHVLGLQGNLSAIERCRKPVLAAIHNSCVGGAIDMVTCCDMRYASEDAWFSVREVEVGLAADVGTLQRLPKLIPDGIARELAYTARKLEADEARDIGLVNRVFPDRDSMMSGVREIAADIASKPPLAVRGTKEMILYTRDHSVEDSLNYVATWNAGMLSAADVREALTAQMEQRAAKFED